MGGLENISIQLKGEAIKSYKKVDLYLKIKCQINNNNNGKNVFHNCGSLPNLLIGCVSHNFLIFFRYMWLALFIFKVAQQFYKNIDFCIVF